MRDISASITLKPYFLSLEKNTHWIRDYTVAVVYEFLEEQPVFF
jgi:hypothetical protein